jgi:hypothetical protein
MSCLLALPVPHVDAITDLAKPTQDHRPCKTINKQEAHLQFALPINARVFQTPTRIAQASALCGRDSYELIRVRLMGHATYMCMTAPQNVVK